MNISSSQDALEWFEKGVLLMQSGSLIKALDAFNHTIQLDPTCARNWNGKGNVLCELGRHEEALEVYDYAIKLDPAYTAAWNGKGNVFYVFGHYEKALEAYERAIQIDRGDPYPWYGKGNVLAALGHYEEALEAYDYAIQVDPNYAVAWNGKGVILNALGHYEEALEAYERAIQLDPKNGLVWNCKGNVQCNLYRYDQAFKSYNHATELDSTLPHPWINCAILLKDPNAHFQDIPRDEAEARFLRSVHLARKPQDVHQLLRGFLKFSRDYVWVPLLARKLFDQCPFFQDTLTFGSYWHEVLQECKTPDILIEAIRRDVGGGDKEGALKIAGLVNYFFGDVFRALELFNEANSLDDQDFQAQYYIIVCMSRFLEPNEKELAYALQQVDKALELSQTVSGEQYYYAGQLRYLTGDHAGAFKCFRSANAFLPAQYMAWHCASQQPGLASPDDILNSILEEEYRLVQSGKSGYLVLPDLAELNVECPEEWHDAILHIARFGEISEAVFAVSLLQDLDRFAPYGKLFPKIKSRLFDCSELLEDQLRTWKWHSSTKVAYDQIRQKATAAKIAVLAENITEHLKSLGLPLDPCNSQELATQVGETVWDNNFSLKDPPFESIIQYYCIREMLNIDDAAFLSVYCQLKQHFDVGKLEMLQKAKVAATTASVLTPILPLLPEQVMERLLCAGIAVGANGLRFLLEYAIEDAKKRQGQAAFPRFNDFKEEFYLYVNKLSDGLNLHNSTAKYSAREWK